MTERLHDLIVLGAGPIGLEMGLAAAEAGLDVLLLERGQIADNVRRWGFVQLFSTWQQNTSARGRSVCGNVVADDSYLSGRELRELYWLPLARTPLLGGRIREGCEVVSVGRAGGFKHTHLGDASRAELPFHILAEEGGEERLFRARSVVDTSGVYGNHRWLGAGGIPAPGERAAAPRISYELLDLSIEPESWSGKTLAIVGAGYSACTALEQLQALRARGVEVDAHWVYLDSTGPPLTPVEADPLPYRRRLAELGNALAQEPPNWLRVHAGHGIEALKLEDDALAFTLDHGGPALRCAQMLAHVGFRPDRSLSEELQFHECWATSGPMKLAGELLSQQAEAGADCLSIGDTGPDTLKNPEPGFYVLGAKSYGRNPDFLIQRGHAQVEAVLGFLLERSELAGR